MAADLPALARFDIGADGTLTAQLAALGYVPADVDTAIVSRLEPTDDPALAPFTESLDVMGDGSLMLLPTPGHTAGSVSLLVRRTAGPPLSGC